ncbi:hypothetical protein NLI96_g7204 [Meripilus lineatus]|uniref:Uncharacterized protein n=1 Tax=Meripilus lineatus TaxID=2056292 RepID=A0AAD5V1V6_9APHY|nr:hypothetical protein NLI96_g7204 [Physisporinus lineatus]
MIIGPAGFGIRMFEVRDKSSGIVYSELSLYITSTRTPVSVSNKHGYDFLPCTLVVEDMNEVMVEIISTEFEDVFFAPDCPEVTDGRFGLGDKAIVMGTLEVYKNSVTCKKIGQGTNEWGVKFLIGSPGGDFTIRLSRKETPAQISNAQAPAVLNPSTSAKTSQEDNAGTSTGESASTTKATDKGKGKAASAGVAPSAGDATGTAIATSTGNATTAPQPQAAQQAKGKWS